MDASLVEELLHNKRFAIFNRSVQLQRTLGYRLSKMQRAWNAVGSCRSVASH